MSVIFKSDRKKIAAQMTGGERKPEHVIGEQDQVYAHLAGEIMDALKSGSAHELAVALKAFFYQCDAEPHEEGPHE